MSTALAWHVVPEGHTFVPPGLQTTRLSVAVQLDRHSTTLYVEPPTDSPQQTWPAQSSGPSHRMGVPGEHAPPDETQEAAVDDWKQQNCDVLHVDDPQRTPGAGGGGSEHSSLMSVFTKTASWQYQLSPFSSQHPTVVTVPQSPASTRFGGHAIGLAPDGSAPWYPHA